MFDAYRVPVANSQLATLPREDYQLLLAGDDLDAVVCQCYQIVKDMHVVAQAWSCW